jgi:hypothetical protein
VVRAAGLLVIFALTGCVRDPAPAVCPDLAEGDLVVTEIGGPQTGADTLKPWVELYNASGAPVDLLGTKLRFRKLDGSGETDALVRRSLVVDPGGYVVLGLDDDADLASYLDYGMSGDYHTSWLTSAALDIEVCGLRVDRAQYSSLPKNGTYSLGVTPPTAEANDLPTNWCTDVTDNPGSFPGSPRRANAACP